MKHIYILLFFGLFSSFVFGETYTVSINGLDYTPSTLVVKQGDMVDLPANAYHPLVEVDRATWESNGVTPKTNGFGTKTENYTITISSTDTIFYVCSAHAALGMKGMIVVENSTGISENVSISGGLVLYPVPATDLVNIKTPGFVTSGTVEVLNAIGQVLISKQVDLYSEIMSINIASLKNGVYFMRLSSEDFTEVKRFLIKN